MKKRHSKMVSSLVPASVNKPEISTYYSRKEKCLYTLKALTDSSEAVPVILNYNTIRSYM